MTSRGFWTRRRFLATSAGLSLVAATARAGQPAARLRAGAAKVDITLPLGANNGGVILRGGPANDVHDNLYARCLVLDDGRTQLALVVCDLRMIHRDLIDRAKRLAAEALGWPVENMLVSATHTHAAPGLLQIQQGPLDRWYNECVVVRIADAIRRAAARLAPARIGWGSVAKPEHVFNRRWKVKPGTAPPDPFGGTRDTVVTNPPRTLDVLEPAGTVDPELSVLCVQHADGRPLAAFANYGLHYVGGYTPNTVSADYFGIFAERVGESVGAQPVDEFVGLMSNGASGDVNNVDRRSPPERAKPWEKMRSVADDLAQAAAKVFQAARYGDASRLSAALQELELPVRCPDTERLRWARELVQTIEPGKPLSRSQIYAEEALALAAGPATVRVPLQVMQIGDLRIATAPCEVFAETGLEIKQRSQQPTFLVELANGFNGYLPTPEQHSAGGYETWAARTSYLGVDAAPQIQDALVKMA